MTVVYLFTFFFFIAFLILGAILAIVSPDVLDRFKRGVRFITARKARQLSPTESRLDEDADIEGVHHFE